MSATAADPAASRIIAHMNKDHHDTLVRFLEHHCSLPSYTARHAHLDSITPSSLQLSLSTANTGPSPYTIPLDPPLGSFSEARARLVAMDAACVAALGRDAVTVRAFVPMGAAGTPAVRAQHLAVGVACVLTFALLFRRVNLEVGPGSRAWGPWRALGRAAPGFIEFAHRVQPRVFWGMVGIHSTEAWWMERSRLQRHSVPRLSGLWWLWVVSTFFEGFGNFQRFDELVAEERRKKEKANH